MPPKNLSAIQHGIQPFGIIFTGMLIVFTFLLFIQTGPAVAKPVSKPVSKPASKAISKAPTQPLMILLDASGSMRDPLPEGIPKIKGAQQALLNILKQTHPKYGIGLRVFGAEGTSCQDTQRLFLPGSSNRNLLSQKVLAIQPKGATPMGYALEQAVRHDFPADTDLMRIILVTDGLESCGEPLCDVVARLRNEGFNLHIDTVGYLLRDFEAVQQLSCVALSTQAKLYRADTAASLINALNELTTESAVSGCIVLPDGSRACSGGK